jgi:hypothetical protein
VTAAAIAMPSAEQLAAVAAGGGEKAAGVAGDGQSEVQGAQHDQVVGKVLADSLAGGNGHESPIDAALNNLPSHPGSNAGLDAVASHGGGDVPAWHSAEVAGFASAHNVFSMESMMLHHDAVPPAAHSG